MVGKISFVVCVLACIVVIGGCARESAGMVDSTGAIPTLEIGTAAPMSTQGAEVDKSKEMSRVYTKSMIKVGVLENNNPFSYRDGDRMLGTDVQLAKQIALDMSKEVMIVAMAREEIITGIQDGTLDMGFGNFTCGEIEKMVETVVYYDVDGKQYCAFLPQEDEYFHSVIDSSILSILEFQAP